MRVWAKTNGALGSLYRSQHEFLPLFKGNAPHVNNVKLGKRGRWPTGATRGKLLACLSRFNQDRVFAGLCLEAANDEINIKRIDFDAAADAASSCF
jgi:hypothetical protein